MRNKRLNLKNKVYSLPLELPFYDMNKIDTLTFYRNDINTNTSIYGYI